MKRSFHCLISTTLILSITLGCSIFNIPIGAPDPNQELLNAINQGPEIVSPEQVTQAEQALFASMREQGGIRAAFGDQADAIFLKIDQDAAAAMDEMMNRVRGAVSSPLKVSVLTTKTGISSTTRSSPLDTRNYWTKSMVLSLMELIGAPEVANLKRTDTGNVDGPVTERGDPNGTGDYYFFQPKFLGSRMEATGKLRMANQTQFVGGGVYNESVGYTFSMELCPDAQGNVPLQFSFKSTVGQPGAGGQVGVVSQVTGHVNDEGKLTSWDDTSTYQGARQPMQGAGADQGTANMFFEAQVKSTENKSNNSGTATVDENSVRYSSAITVDFVKETISPLNSIKSFLILQAMDIAEKKWTTGYCVEIQVPELGTGTKSVQPNSDTPFTAKVRHKFEGVDLQVPVIATLSDGQVSVSPSGSKVQAPASFSYKAPGENDKSATVNLVTRSKRGVATLDIKFKTGGQGWKVDQPVPGLTGNFTGLSCSSPYGPWEITYEGPDSMGMNRVGIFHVPLFEDGKSIATLEESGSTDYSGYNVVSTVDATIAPDANGYLIDFKSQTMTGTMWVTGAGSRTINLTTPGYKISVLPADPGQCTQP